MTNLLAYHYCSLNVSLPAARFLLRLADAEFCAASRDDFLIGLILQIATAGNVSCCWWSTLSFTLIGYPKYFLESSTTLYSNTAAIPIITSSQKTFLNPPACNSTQTPRQLINRSTSQPTSLSISQSIYLSKRQNMAMSQYKHSKGCKKSNNAH